MIQPD